MYKDVLLYEVRTMLRGMFMNVQRARVRVSICIGVCESYIDVRMRANV